MFALSGMLHFVPLYVANVFTNKLYKTYLKNPTLQNKSNFNKYRNKFKTLKTETIRIYYAERFVLCANDLNKTWSIIKELLNSMGDTGFPHTFLIDGTETKDALIIAENFNSYFTNLVPKLAEKIPHSPKSCDAFMPHSPPCSFGLLPTSSSEIIQISLLLKNSTSRIWPCWRCKL